MTKRLPNRRASESSAFIWNGMDFTATVSRFTDGRLAEIFLSNGKIGGVADATARDSAVVCSLALQHGVPVETIQHALLRDGQGVASARLECALDLIAGDENEMVQQ